MENIKLCCNNDLHHGIFVRSKMSSWYLLVSAGSKTPLMIILQFLTSKLKTLETGIPYANVTMKAHIIAYIGDNLELNEIGKEGQCFL